MTIRVYPSKIEGEHVEKYETVGVTTIESWLESNVKGYSARESHPISIELNGCIVSPEDWSLREFSGEDDVRIYVEPKGAELIIAAVTLGAAFQFVTSLLVPKLPSQNKGGQGQGESLSDTAVKGNKVNLNSPIREVAGRRKIYPDYLVPTHRYFEDKRTQVIETLLCVGVGKFDIPSSGILIGDTPIISLGDDASFQFYQPGASVGADQRADWWHSSTEVGATSNGSSGLRLETTFPATPVSSATAYNFNGFNVTVPGGHGQFPADWAAGMITRILVEYPYTVIDGGGAVRDIIQGDLDHIAPFVGMNIEITGDNAGLYVVNSFTPGSPDQMTLSLVGGAPANNLQLGSVSMCIGFKGLRYRMTAASTSTITVERLTDTGSTDGTWPGFLNLTSFDALISLDPSSTEANWAGPFVACPEGEVASEIEVDFMFPGGLIGLDAKGRPYPVHVDVEVQYRDYALAGAWTSVPVTYEDTTKDQIGATLSISLPSSFRPEVRVRRTLPPSTLMTEQDATEWYGLRAKLIAPTSYDDVTTMALRVRSGNRLAGQSENLVSVKATRILPYLLDGTWQAEAPTRDIAAWVRYVVNSLGYTDADIDMDELSRLNDIWQARSDFYDNSTDSTTTAKEVLGDAMAAGFAELTVDRGLIRPVRDEPRTVYEHMYTPQNMTDAMTRGFKALNVDDFDGVDVEYMDEDTWQVETVECRLLGDIGARVEKMKVNGVTNRTKAWRIGMRQRRAQKYRRKTFSFNTEMDAFNSRYLSFCAIGDDVPGYGQSAILESIAPMGGAQLLVSSEPLDWSAGGVHMVAIRKPDGILSGPYVATRIDDFRLTIPSIDFTTDTSWDIEPPHLLFGPVNRWSYPVLITDISPSGNTGADVSAMNYDERVYDSDNDSAPD